jgi:hypothetical protein
MQQKIVAVHQALQQMGTSMMTVVKQIQILMDICTAGTLRRSAEVSNQATDNGATPNQLKVLPQ